MVQPGVRAVDRGASLSQEGPRLGSRARRGVSPSALVSSRGYEVWIALVTASVFGPYVVGTARTEQLMVYASAIVAVIRRGWSWPRFKPSAIPILLLLLVPFVISLLDLLEPLSNGAFGQYSVLSGINDQTLPVALILLTWHWRSRLSPDGILRPMAAVVVLAMSLNTIVALAQWRGWLPADVLQSFWTGGSGQSVAFRAAAQSRYSGEFNQPAEAGVAYSVALLLALWLAMRSSRGRRGVLLSMAVVLIAVGGLLTISKAFIFAGIPAALLFIVLSRSVRHWWLMLIVGGSVGAVTLGLAQSDWGGYGSLAALVSPASWNIGALSAGRFGSQSTLAPVWDYVTHQSFWVGLGAGGINYAYDSLWVEALIYAGIIGLTCWIALVVVLVKRLLQGRREMPRIDRGLAGALLLVVIGAAFGLPVLTANRVTTLLWIPLTALLVCGNAAFSAPVAPYQRSERDRR